MNRGALTFATRRLAYCRLTSPVADGRYGAQAFVTVDDLLHYVALAAVCWRAAKMRGAP
jgi:hypothetical protein